MEKLKTLIALNRLFECKKNMKTFKILKNIYYSEHMPNSFKKTIMFFFKKYKRIRYKVKERYLFPLSFDGRINYMCKSIFNDNGDSYYPLYYGEGYITKANSIEDNYSYKIEIYRADKYQNDKIINFLFKEDSLLPVAFIKEGATNNANNDFSIEIIKNKEKYILENITPNRYTNLHFQKNDLIEISNSRNLIIGKDIPLLTNKKNQKKLVLVLFIDALGGTIFDKYDMKEVIPNTFNFFKKGVIFNKSFANAEYTVTSLASMHTGKYVHNNDFFHPKKQQQLGKNSKTIQSYFKESNYYTQLISSNSGQNPSNGYCKNYDRTVYKVDMKCHEVIHEFIDSLRVFGTRDTFTWLTFMEIHHNVSRTLGFSAESALSLDGHNYQESRSKSIGAKSPFMKYCVRKEERYIEELKRVDYHMKILYDFLETNYSDDEMLVSLVSDHGHSSTNFTKKNEPLLRKEKISVPFMIRGSSQNHEKITEEMIDNVDILPTILKYSGLDYNKHEIDGVVPKTLGGKGKDFIFSESIYPGQTYKATIKSILYECFLESDQLIDDTGVINLNQYSFFMENIITGEKITDKHIIDKHTRKIIEIIKGGK